MRSFRFRLTMLAMAASMAVASCGSSDRPPAIEPMPPSPPPPPAAVDFTGFVIEQFAATADDTDPVAVDDMDFEFNDQDNPDAFAELLTDP